METGLGLVLEDVPYQLGNICGVWGHCVPGGHIAHTLGKPLWGTVRDSGHGRRHLCPEKEDWGAVLAGCICSLIGPWILGIPAIVFVALGKNEFE